MAGVSGLKPPSRGAAEARYRDIRRAALTTAEVIARSALPEIPRGLTAINPTATQAFLEHWDGNENRRYPWPWPHMVAQAQRAEPARFEVAVWSGQTLCGLALGRVRSQFVGIDYLEACPDPDHPLKGKVALMAFAAATAYATALGKRELRLLEPLPGAIPLYQALGFTLAAPKGESSYCWRSLV